MSRITNRKGLQENLPQLASAELGWALDSRRLFIGNGEIVDGAPAIGNTELLTEFSDILAMSSTYTYKGSAAGYVVSTGLNDEDVIRSLQSKFDEVASVKDFGAVGDGITDDTAAINRALYELFCRGGNAGFKRSLYFPAGIYRVTGKIKIPPHAKLWGEGLTSSIIKFIAGDNIPVANVVTGTRYAISAVNGSDFTQIGASSNAVDVIFTATAGTPGGTGTIREVPMQVVETSDSSHQTGANMSGVLPIGIEMNAMGIHSEEKHTLLKLDSVTDSGFSYLGLSGPSGFVPSNDVEGTSAVEIATSVSTTSNVTIGKFVTSNTTYGLRAEGEIKGVVLENSGLDFHYKGVHVINPTINAGSFTNGNEYTITVSGNTDFTLLGAADSNPGTVFTATGAGVGSGQAISTTSPTGVVVARNIFDNIVAQGVHYENVLFNSTSHNVFYDVANGVANTPVIEFRNDVGIIRSVSIGDLFERNTEVGNARRVLLNGNGGIYTDGAHSIHLGSYERQVGLEAVLTSASSGAIFSNINALPNSYQVDYNIARVSAAGIPTTATRMGTIRVSAHNGVVVYDDEYTETGSTPVDVVLHVAETVLTGDSELQFVSTDAADAIINFSVVRLD